MFLQTGVSIFIKMSVSPRTCADSALFFFTTAAHLLLGNSIISSCSSSSLPLGDDTGRARADSSSSSFPATALDGLLDGLDGMFEVPQSMLYYGSCCGAGSPARGAPLLRAFCGEPLTEHFCNDHFLPNANSQTSPTHSHVKQSF